MDEISKYIAAKNVFDGTTKNTKTGRDVYVTDRIPDFFTSSASPFVAHHADPDTFVDYRKTSADGVTVSYLGPQLTAFDEDLLYAILSVLKTTAIEVPDRNSAEEYGYENCTFEASYSDLLRQMGYSVQASMIKKLQTRLRYLQATSITVQLPNEEWNEGGFSLIGDYVYSDKRKCLNVKLSPHFLRLYAIRDHYSTNLALRRQLKSSPARRLVSYLERWKIFRDGEELVKPFNTVADAIHWWPSVHKRACDFKRIAVELKEKLGIEVELYKAGLKRLGSQREWKIRAIKRNQV